MSDKMRWRYGDTNPVVAAVDAATVIEIGDLVYQDTDDTKPAASQANQGSKTANQELFVDKFLGVAMQRSRSGDTAPIRVATTGVFEYDCPSGTFELGNLVGCDANTAGTTLLNQQVATVAASKYAVGRVAKRVTPAATALLVDVRSSIMTGGVEGSSPSGV
jgi:D-alanyl-D-alanine carboxypeptidase